MNKCDYLFKGAVVQLEKALINHHLPVSKVSQNYL